MSIVVFIERFSQKASVKIHKPKEYNSFIKDLTDSSHSSQTFSPPVANSSNSQIRSLLSSIGESTICTWDWSFVKVYPILNVNLFCFWDFCFVKIQKARLDGNFVSDFVKVFDEYYCGFFFWTTVEKTLIPCKARRCPNLELRVELWEPKITTSVRF